MAFVELAVQDLHLYEILVPTVKNKCDTKKKWFSLKYHRIWDAKVRAITGGLTILPVNIGQWLNPTSGELFIERMIPVKIFATQEQIDQIADITANHYNQLAIFLLSYF